MEELFADMQKKGLIKVEKPMTYSVLAYAELVNLYDSTLPLGDVEPDFVDGYFPVEGVVEDLAVGQKDVAFNRRN